MAYTYSEIVTIDHTKCGSSDSTSFPFLFAGTYAALATVLNGGNIVNTVTVNGQTVPADLIFTSDALGTSLLSWEVASYNAATGAIEVWIKLPTLSHSTNTVLYFFAGNALVTTYQGGSLGAAWDTNYVGVWHYGGAAALGFNDSTSNGFNATGTGSPTQATGPFSGSDGAVKFAPYGAYVLASSGSGFAGYSTGSAYSLELWIKGDPSDAYNGTVVCTQNGSGGPQMGFTGDTLGFGWYGIGTIFNQTGSTPLDNTWHKIDFIYDGSTTGYLYIDGALNNSGGANLGTLTPTNAYMGQYGGGGVFQNGYLDEFRISKTNRSADWILSSYNNQSSPATFYSLGSIPATSVPWGWNSQSDQPQNRIEIIGY